MANLFPRHTGLPFVVWISVKGGAKHDVRVKVSPGAKVQASELISVALRPAIRVVDGEMDSGDLVLLSKWIELNRDVIIRYWEGDIDTVDAVTSIQSVGADGE